MLESAPEDHILVINAADPGRVEKMLKDEPGAFVKAVLRSYGDMTITKLEDVCVQNGFIKAAGWKSFWEKARAELRKDKLVDIPVKRTDPISLRASVEDYGDGWLTAFSHETDPKLILAGVREYVAQGKFKIADDETKRKLEERLAFAVTAARKVDDALYARLACAVTELGFATPSAAEMREYLWERKRFVTAVAELPAREVGEFLAFLAVDDQAKDRIYKAIPEFCYAAVVEIAERFGEDENCRKAVGALLKEPKAPATLVTLVSGKYEKFMEWSELPSQLTVLTHAVALGEGRQSGETLKMQNIVRRLFADRNWLEKMLKLLSADDRALFFERFQASIAWDHATHHAIVVRMTKIAPELEPRMVKAEKKREYARITSPRSYEERQREYFKLINEEMPANVKRIEFAKSYGDLSENAEYQYAKDEQRVLMQKQTVMQAELDAVKAGDFSDATTDEVMPGVEVVVEAKDGERRYVILGEWDNDLERGIISSQTKVAKNLMGKKVGDKFELPDAEGSVELASVKEILPLSDEVKAWMKI
jgi:transcription elongation GreA/GreB family factor